MTRSHSPRTALLVAVTVAAALIAATAATARAQEAFTHVVRDGETLASIAQRYYGDPRREMVLVRENGLASGTGAAVVPGMRLVVPWVRYHRVAEGETWASLAERYYGDARRAFVLIDANRTSQRTQPALGAELAIPYPLRYVSDVNDTLRQVATAFYGGNKKALATLSRFNPARTGKLGRGQVVLVPLDDLVLSEEGKALVEETLGRSVAGGEARAVQAWADGELPKLAAYVRKGAWAECVALGNRLLGTNLLAATQAVSIQRDLGIAYVALGRPDQAADAFLEALRLQPDLSMSPMEASPTVLRALEAARQRHAKETRASAAPTDLDGGAPAPEPATPPTKR